MMSATYATTQVSALPNTADEYGPLNLTPYGNQVLFEATNPATGKLGIWITDGTATDTRLLPISVSGDELIVATSGSDIYFASGSIDFSFNFPNVTGQPVSAASELYVTSDQGVTKTDLGPLNAGAGISSASTTFKGNVYFVVSNDLYVSNGTRSGTKVIYSSLGDFGTVASLASTSGELYADGGEVLVASDGTAAGTHVISNSSDGAIAVLNDTFYFLADGSGNNNAIDTLWTSDGTTGGTVDLAAGVPSDDFLPNLTSMVSVDGKLFMSGQPQPSGQTRLYTSVGTAGSIIPVNSPGATIDAVLNLVSFDNQAVFYSGSSLCTSDGTDAGTREVLLDGFYTLTSAGDLLIGNTTDTYNDIGTRGDPVYVHESPGQVFSLGQATVVPTPVNTAALTASITNINSAKIVQMNDVATVMVSIANSGNTAAAGTVSRSIAPC